MHATFINIIYVDNGVTHLLFMLSTCMYSIQFNALCMLYDEININIIQALIRRCIAITTHTFLGTCHEENSNISLITF